MADDKHTDGPEGGSKTPPTRHLVDDNSQDRSRPADVEGESSLSSGQEISDIPRKKLLKEVKEKEEASRLGSE